MTELTDVHARFEDQIDILPLVSNVRFAKSDNKTHRPNNGNTLHRYPNKREFFKDSYIWSIVIVIVSERRDIST